MEEQAQPIFRERDQYGSFFKRIAALLIDFLFVLAGLTVTFSLLALIMVTMTSITYDQLVSIFAQLQQLETGEIPIEDAGSAPKFLFAFRFPIYLIFTVLYHAFSESSALQGSPGKMIMGMRVANKDGEPITFWHAFARNLLAWILAFLTLTVGHLMAEFTKKRQALHDKITGCIILNRVKPSL